MAKPKIIENYNNPSSLTDMKEITRKCKKKLNSRRKKLLACRNTTAEMQSQVKNGTPKMSQMAGHKCGASQRSQAEKGRRRLWEEKKREARKI